MSKLIRTIFAMLIRRSSTKLVTRSEIQLAAARLHVDPALLREADELGVNLSFWRMEDPGQKNLEGFLVESILAKKISLELSRRRDIARQAVLGRESELKELYKPFFAGINYTEEETSLLLAMLVEAMPDDHSRAALMDPILERLGSVPGAELKYRLIRDMINSIQRNSIRNEISPSNRSSASQSSHKESSPNREIHKKAEDIMSDDLLRAEWHIINNNIGRIYQILGPPPLRTISGARHGR
jgi:hypothetical protein